PPLRRRRPIPTPTGWGCCTSISAASNGSRSAASAPPTRRRTWSANKSSSSPTSNRRHCVASKARGCCSPHPTATAAWRSSCRNGRSRRVRPSSENGLAATPRSAPPHPVGNMTARAPEMSVVLVTPDGYQAIRKTISHLRAQTIRDQLEIIIVAPSADTLDPYLTELRDFLQFHVIEVGPIRSTGRAVAAGVRRASAPIVAYAEEHSYPEAGWAAALVEAHRGAWAGVGGVLRNANPRSVASWANLILDF